MSSFECLRLHREQNFNHVLFQIPDPPETLSVLGKADAFSLLERLPNSGLAVVGTREPEMRTQNLVSKVIYQLRDSGLIVISGFARGVDTHAHASALKFNLPTIAVLGCGLDVSYPPENDSLKGQILESGGLLITELLDQERPKPHTFLKRNRLIACLSKAIWIAQAPIPSGALNTAAWGRKIERDIYVTPHFPDYAPFAGNQRLLETSEAFPLLNASSLSTTWLDLSIGNQKTKKEGFQDLFNEAFKHGLPIEECFNALQQEYWAGRIRFENGRMVRI